MLMRLSSKYYFLQLSITAWQLKKVFSVTTSTHPKVCNRIRLRKALWREAVYMSVYVFCNFGCAPLVKDNRCWWVISCVNCKKPLRSCISIELYLERYSSVALVRVLLFIEDLYSSMHISQNSLSLCNQGKAKGPIQLCTRVGIMHCYR